MSDSLILKEATVQLVDDGPVVITPTGANPDMHIDRVEVGLLINFLKQAAGVMR